MRLYSVRELDMVLGSLRRCGFGNRDKRNAACLSFLARRTSRPPRCLLASCCRDEGLDVLDLFGIQKVLPAVIMVLPEKERLTGLGFLEYLAVLVNEEVSAGNVQAARAHGSQYLVLVTVIELSDLGVADHTAQHEPKQFLLLINTIMGSGLFSERPGRLDEGDEFVFDLAKAGAEQWWSAPEGRVLGATAPVMRGGTGAESHGIKG